MYQNIFHLLKTRRFLPLFTTQFLSAFNDNLFKIALVLLIKFQVDNLPSGASQTLTTVAAGIFILPFILISPLAGQLADKFDKAKLIQIIRASEIFLMSLGAVGFFLKDVYLLLLVLFLMGTKSAFFGPLKYSILPVHLRQDELIGGNGMIEMATFLSILLGTVLGGLLIAGQGGRLNVSILAILLAILGFLSSRYILKAPSIKPGLKINFNFFTEALHIFKMAAQNRPVIIAILGISWFWLVGATFLAQFPNYAKDIVSGNEEVATLLLLTLSTGIGVGSLLCNRLLKSKISSRLAPFSALVLGLFCVDIYFSSQAVVVSQEIGLMGVSQFLSHPGNWRIIFDLIMISVAGGIYIVPLYAILQTTSSDINRSRMIAANNIMNAVFMVASVLATLVMFSFGFTVLDIFMVLGIITIAVSVLFFMKPNWENV